MENRKINRRDSLKLIGGLALALISGNSLAQKQEGSKYRWGRVDYHIYNSWKDRDGDGKMDPSEGELTGMDKDAYFHEEPLRMNLGVYGFKDVFNPLTKNRHIGRIRMLDPKDEPVFDFAMIIDRVNWSMWYEYRTGIPNILKKHGEGLYTVEFYVDGTRVGYRDTKLRWGNGNFGKTD